MDRKAAFKALFECPTITPEQLHASGAMQVSRNSLYEALGRGEIHSFRIGKRFVIPTSPLRRKLGLEDRQQ